MTHPNLKVTDEMIQNALVKSNDNRTAAAKLLGIARNTLQRRIKHSHSVFSNKKDLKQVDTITEKQVSGQWVIETQHSRINTIEDVIKQLNIDMNVWRIKSFERSHWDTTMKIKTTDETDKPFIVQNSRLKAVFERIVSEETEQGINELLQRIENKSIPRLPVKLLKMKNKSDRALEICLLDPHYGMRCFAPASDGDWTPEICRRIMIESLRQLVNRAILFGPFQEIVLPLGNDFFHIDSLWHTTTRGTAQPEADAFHHSFESGEYLAVEIVEEIKALFPQTKIKIYFIPGNHDRTSSFMLGRILKAYYKNDK
ncbi:MAG: helix-turn-helix domain-containing protein, partial [Nitrosopumilus sp.]